jgi:hypothetical protein
MTGKARHHKWDHAGERRIAGVDTPDGNARNERDCVLCGITRITVLTPEFPPRAWHEWRTKNGNVYVGEATPPCIGTPAPPELSEAK